MKPDPGQTSGFYAYRSELVRGPLMAAAVLILLTIFVPFPLLQLVFFASATGPFAWALIQLARRNRGVRLGADELCLQSALTGRFRRIPYAKILGYTSQQDHLIVAFQVDPPQEPPRSDSLALTDARPETHRYPRKRLAESAPLANSAVCVEALSVSIPVQSPALFTDHDLVTWAKRLRLRNRILAVLVILATPLWVIIVQGIFHSILSLGGSSLGR